MSMTELRVAGLGGQGVILSAMIIGKAASIFQQGYATLTQSFGPEARGSACSASVIISSDPVHYPYVEKPDLLITMSQDAYTKFAPGLKPNGTLLVEEDLVKVTDVPSGVRVVSIPATRLAEEIGKRLVLNIVMVGFFGAVTGIIDKEAMKEAVKDSVPPGTEEMNLNAFEKGWEHGSKKTLAEAPEAVSMERGLNGQN